MPSDKWDVESALAEVVRAIQDGSSLSITGLEYGYKKRYEKDFKEHWKNDEDKYSWPNARMRILAAAEMVGSLATTLTIYRAFTTGTPIPRTVDAQDAYWAGHLVAKVVCPQAGQWCMYYDDYSDAAAAEPTLSPPPPDFREVDKSFRTFLGEIDNLRKKADPPGGSAAGRP